MNFIKALLTLVLFFTESQSHATNNYQDWWWNPAQSGMGLNVGQQNDTIFVAWFNYGEDTKASLLTMGGVLSGNTLTGPLYRNTGPVPGPNYNPALVKQTAVGTATITFNSNADATLTYSYDNKGGTMALQRFNFASPNLNQTWTVLNTLSTTGCANASLNGSSINNQLFVGQQITDSKFSFKTMNLDGSNVCLLSLTGQATGSRMTAIGTLQCEGGSEVKVNVDDLSIQSDYLNFSVTLSGAQGDSKSCIGNGNIVGVVKKNTRPAYDFKTAFQTRLLNGLSKTFNVAGDCNGTFSLTDSAAIKTTWKGQTVYAVSSIQTANLPNCSLGISGNSFITYYDMNFLEVAQINSSGSYSEFVPVSNPTTVKVGDSGTLGTWYHWNDASKSLNWGSNVRTYIVEPGTSSYVILNVIDRNYSSDSQLISTSQIRYHLTDSSSLEMVSATSDFTNNNGHLVLQ